MKLDAEFAVFSRSFVLCFHTDPVLFPNSRFFGHPCLTAFSKASFFVLFQSRSEFNKVNVFLGCMYWAQGGGASSSRFNSFLMKDSFAIPPKVILFISRCLLLLKRDLLDGFTK